MPIVLQDQSGIAQGIGTAGQAIASGLEKRAQNRLMRQQRGALSQVVGNSDLSNQAGQKDFFSKYTQAGGEAKDALSIIKQQQVDPFTEWLQSRLSGGQQASVEGGIPGGQQASVEGRSPGGQQPLIGGGGQQAPIGGGVADLGGTLEQALRDMPEEVILAASSSPDPGIRGIGTALNQFRSQDLKRDIQSNKEWIQERDFHTKQSDKEAERINSVRFMVPRKITSFQMAQEAVENDDVGMFSKSHIGEVLGVKGFKTASGSQLVTASKEHLIPNLSRLSARAQNQWLQKLFVSMFPEIGVSKFSNLTALTMLREENLLDQKEIEVYDELVRQDEAETAIPGRSGYAKRDIDRRLDETMQPYREKMLKRLSYRTREIWEKEKGLKNLVNKKVPKGTPLTLQMMDVFVRKEMEKNGETVPSKESKERARKLAKGLNYTFPTKEEYTEYSQ